MLGEMGQYRMIWGNRLRMMLILLMDDLGIVIGIIEIGVISKFTSTGREVGLLKPPGLPKCRTVRAEALVQSQNE